MDLQHLRRGPAVLDAPERVGIAISAGICLLAASNLLIDFAVIESGVRSGAPRAMAWFGAFGLLTTLVWLYLEVLRFLALLRARSDPSRSWAPGPSASVA